MLAVDLRNKKLRKGTCPICHSKRHVVEVADLDVNAKMFTAKPLKNYFCSKCKKSFN